jgi:pimeloyl-ACP methyl ester carboxylesterase
MFELFFIHLGSIKNLIFMKTKITLLVLILLSGFTYSQEANKSYDLLKEKTQTKILYDRVYGISNATSLGNKTISTATYKQVYSEIQRADFLQRLPKYEFVKEQATLGIAMKQIPLSVLITEFENVKKEAINNQSVFLNANNEYDSKPNTSNFELNNLTLIAPLLEKSKSNTVTFILKDNLIFNTTAKTITSIAIDCNDGNGYRAININQPLQVTFKEAGSQILHFKMQLSTGEIIEKITSFETEDRAVAVLQKSNAASPNAITSITATIPYQGYGETAPVLGQGEYDIYMDTTNGVLDKPVFIIDALDSGDARSIPTIYNLLNYGTGQNLAGDLRAQGFDVIILNFPTYTVPTTTTVIDGGADYIQRNAMILVELINQINAQKVGTQKNVVIGPSMGGLVARYALRYMEQNSLTHDTRLYISFDAPHKGANVPIGMQHLFNYMAYGPLANTTLQPLVDSLLKSAAAREMLIDQFEGHLQTGSAFEFNTTAASLLPTGCPNYRTAFQTELNTMGFPTTVRNVAIANGASNGAMTGTPGMEVMNHTFNVTTTQRAIINLHFTPLANTQTEVSHFRGQTQVFGFWITAYESLANSKSPTFTAGLDSAPGGRIDMVTLGPPAGTNALLDEFFANLLTPYFDFIPVWSSMAVSSSTNLYAPITAATTTPFLASSIPTVNENHMTLNAQNVLFAYNEIVGPTLSNQSVTFSNLLVKNPINASIEINSPTKIANATLTLTDVLGKIIFTKNNQDIEGNYTIPVTASRGMYLLTITNNEGSVVKKLIKE